MFSRLRTVREELGSVAGGFDPGSLSGEEAVRLVDELGAIRRLIDGMLAKSAKRVDDTQAHKDLGGRDAAALCARTVGVGVREVRRAIDTAAKLERLPATDAAVRAGTLSARQAQMIADAATINPDAECDLIETAAQGLVRLKEACVAARAVVENGAARSARQRAARMLRIWLGDDGMIEGRFRLPPEIGGSFKVAIDTQTQRLFRAGHAAGIREPHDRHAADALVAAVLGVAGGASGTKATVHVVIDHAALVRGGVGEGECCEIPGVGPVSVDWVRELLGAAFVTAVVKKGKDIATVAHFGRHIPAELQTAMIVGGRECDVEHCNARGYLELDHSEVDFAKGGPTAYWNLAWLCYLHHLAKSKGAILGPRDPVTGKRTMRPPGHEDSAAA